ncbi:MAG: dTDP-4-dehydrorhamnose 3,5-epimerase [Acholeplasma sp.]|nr:dTDP-4-dehydrorhamnose 3,5-epimerase [Acholeplasma sp.]
MEKVVTSIKDLYVLKPNVFGDNRGWFSETYNKKILLELGIDIDFVQDNQSFSKDKGTLRGLHLQTNPKAQTKLVRCIKGKILDVAVDLRKDSKTYLQHYAIELSEKNHLELLIPKGFAHGFITLEDNCEVAYKVDEYYSKEHDRSIKYNDELFSINWKIDNPILSEKDKNAPLYKDSDISF